MKLIREDVPDTRLKMASTLFSVASFFMMLLLLVFLKHNVEKYLIIIVSVGWIILNVLLIILSIELRKRKKCGSSEKSNR